MNKKIISLINKLMEITIYPSLDLSLERMQLTCMHIENLNTINEQKIENKKFALIKKEEHDNRKSFHFLSDIDLEILLENNVATFSSETLGISMTFFVRGEKKYKTIKLEPNLQFISYKSEQKISLFDFYEDDNLKTLRGESTNISPKPAIFKISFILDRLLELKYKRASFKFIFPIMKEDSIKEGFYLKDLGDNSCEVSV